MAEGMRQRGFRTNGPLGPPFLPGTARLMMDADSWVDFHERIGKVEDVLKNLIQRCQAKAPEWDRFVHENGQEVFADDLRVATMLWPLDEVFETLVDPLIESKEAP